MNHSKAWENFQKSVEDSKQLIKICEEYKTDQNGTQNILKRSCIILLMTAWETYIEDVCLEIFNSQYKVLQGSFIGNFVKKQCEEQLKKLHNPDSRKVARLFKDFFDIDVTENWVWNNYNQSSEVRKKLDKWLEKRGEVVHRSNTEDNPSKKDIERGIRFICELVNKTDDIIQMKILSD